MQLDYSLSQRQSQQLRLNPQMLRDLKLLQLPLVELQLHMRAELENNPALETIKNTETESLEEYQEKYDKTQEQTENDLSATNTNVGAAERHREIIEGVLSRPESLQEHLLWQLGLQPIEDYQRHFGEMLIYNLDKNGFHKVDPFALLKAHPSQIQSILNIIQKFDPQGICVANMEESLALQAKNDPLCPPYVLDIIQDHLSLLKGNDITVIARRLKISPEKANKIVQYISKLTPYPGQKFSQEPTQFAIPDLTIRYRNHRFEITINEQGIPKLGINHYFLRISEESFDSKDTDAESFARTYVREAQLFIKSLKKRYHTLMNTAQALVKFQGDFFRKGSRYIQPLTLRDVAQELGLHEATISRVTHYKYVQTNWGIYPLRYLFSNSVAIDNNNHVMSRQAIKSILAELITQRLQAGKPVRDRILMDELGNRGVHIARRTVAKYRNELQASALRN